MRRLVAHLYLVLMLVLYGGSFLGALFLTDGAILLGLVAFFVMFLVQVIRHGFARQPFHLKKVWMVAVPVFVAAFVTTVTLSLNRGAPKTDHLPIFAKREHYLFTRGEEVERWRFITVGTSFNLAWHVLAATFAAEQWAELMGIGVPKPGRKRAKQTKTERTNSI